MESTESLSDAQRRELADKGYFHVDAPSGRRYRIDKGSHGNVKVVDAVGQWVESLCIQPRGVPDGDAMLMQKLLIETAEDAFRAHANITFAGGGSQYGKSGLLDATVLDNVVAFRRRAAEGAPARQAA